MTKIKGTNFMVIAIIVLSIIASCLGLFLGGGPGEYYFESINNETVRIYGEGLYRNDSIAMVAQGKASDLITLVIGVPLLLIGLVLNMRYSFRGKLLLTGTLAYFLYTYMSYSFLWSYNKLFLVYVLIMSLSLFSFILIVMSFKDEEVIERFSNKTTTRFLDILQISNELI